jgi:aspartyl-tRNA(Asn)/glutamyl-tRNA(Gln) amidotransferase subunit A
MDHAGPMTRSAEDAARMLAVIAGEHPGDASSSRRPVPDYVGLLGTPVGGMRVGRLRGWFENLGHPDVLAAYDGALAEFADLGIEIVDVELPDVDMVDAATWTIIYAEMLSLHSDHAHLIEERDAMGAGLLAAGPYVHASDYLRALRYRTAFQHRLDEAMTGLDALVTPGATTLPPKLDGMRADLGGREVDWLNVACRTSVPFNYSGSPGLCLPAGPVDGIPTSVQLVGRPHDDGLLLAIGAAYQRATRHHEAAPTLDGVAAEVPDPVNQPS